jgi:riboflavin synthase alpha subunit
MFTGIVRKIGKVKTRRRSAAGLSMTVSGFGAADGVSEGDSVAVNGVCQTVEKAAAGEISFTAVGETLKRTTLGSLTPGAPVNLETAARADTLLGGHIVQGHVDGVGTVRSFARSGKDWLLKVSLPPEMRSFVVAKGSIAIDGVSLTVIDVKRGGLVSVTVIPFTMEHTVAASYRSGTKVNIETDIIGKYARGAEGSSPGGRLLQA